MALVAGRVDEPMTIEGFLTKDEAVNKVQITKEPISDESLPIKTAYKCHIILLCGSVLKHL